MKSLKNVKKITSLMKYFCISICILLCFKVNSQFLGDSTKIKFQPKLDLRTASAIGFFPLGGSTNDYLGLSSYSIGVGAIGAGFDFIKFENEGGSFTLLNLSAYLVGLNRSTIESQVIQMAYFRLGPHFKFDTFNKKNPDSKFSLGGQIGLGSLIEALPTEARSRFQYGIDVSFTFSFN